MITKTERKQLKKLLGTHYAETILAHLNNKGVTNSHGNPHTLQYIRTVFTGLRNNKDVEMAIYNIALKCKEETEALKAKKQLILQK